MPNVFEVGRTGSTRRELTRAQWDEAKEIPQEFILKCGKAGILAGASRARLYFVSSGSAGVTGGHWPGEYAGGIQAPGNVKPEEWNGFHGASSLRDRADPDAVQTSSSATSSLVQARLVSAVRLESCMRRSLTSQRGYLWRSWAFASLASLSWSDVCTVGIGLPPIMRFGTPELKQRVGPSVLSCVRSPRDPSSA